KSVRDIYKSIGDGFDTTVSQVDGETKKVTQDYESYAKRISTLEKQINTELEKAASLISKIRDKTEKRVLLEKELNLFSSSDVNEETLKRAEDFVRRIEERLTKEKEEAKISSEINKELNKALSYIVKMQEGTEARLSLEKKLEGISSKKSTQESLSEARELTRQSELQLSYEKNRLSISEQISNELRKASETMSKIPSGYSGLSSLK